MPIRRLPPLLVNQIAAGEVIERPASVVKELVENSIDAGARRIDVQIEDGGRELIVVADDGGGIPMDELALAIAPHATSKIGAAEDLDAIATMGFRGEALASIASISRLRMISRTSEQPGGAILDVEGDDAGEVKPHPAAIGTSVQVRNLFFNTPARRKFLKTAVTEASRIGQVLESIALAHPHIGFGLRSGERQRIDLKPVDSPRQRVIDVLGRELEQQFLEVNLDRTDDRGITIWGLVGLPEIARANANHQRLYLNGRPIRDRSLQHALKEAYRGLIEPGRYPTLVLFIEMNPREVDVNVHPAKAEVRFRNQSMVHGTVLGAVRNRLREGDLTPRIDTSRLGGNWQGALQPAGGASTPEFGAGRVPGHPQQHVATAAPGGAQSAREFVDYFRRLDPHQKGQVYSEVKQVLVDESPQVALEVMDPGAREAEPDAGLPEVKPIIGIMQVHSSYLVTQDASGLVIIDQHALHERVMFEKLMDRIGSGTLESQHLLMPEVVEADSAEVDQIDALQPLCGRIGIEAQRLSPTSVGIHAFPTFLLDRGVEVAPFVKELLEKSLAGTLGDGNIEAALHETVDMMACKAAVKAGDRLSGDELTELLAYRDSVERSSNCPHGRPTTLRLSIDELDRQFGRS